MSHIPSHAMKHAGAPAPDADEKKSATPNAATRPEAKNAGSSRLSQLKDQVKANPKTVAAAGLAAVGLVAAAAIPALKARKGASAKSTKSAKAKTAKKEKAAR